LHIQHTNNVPFVKGSNISYESVGVGLLKYSSFMGAFPLSSPTTATINMLSSKVQQSPRSIDPWVVPDPSTTEFLGDTMPISPVEATYDAIQSVDHHSNCDDVHLVASDPFSLPSWVGYPPPSFDYLSNTFPSDESIMEIVSLEELLWKDHHHRSSFLPDLATVEENIKSIVPPKDVDMSQSPILTHHVLSKGNLGNITLTIFIDIS
jgi:hypothetical protein